jgi:hypothetical protein
MDIEQVKNQAWAFKAKLEALKQKLAPADFAWYPYETLANFAHLEALLSGRNRFLLDLIGAQTALDIGGADGDLAFFLESIGCEMQLLDNPPTNYNGLRGAKLLKQALSSSVEIYETDLDAQFSLPQQNYGAIFLLGILYHLKNPYYVLEKLAQATRYCFISTRIARFSPDHLLDFSRVPIAYLLLAHECNNDPTNFWIFSDAGLRRILDRTGWEICDYITVGNTVNSDPVTLEGDERAFCLVKSRYIRA